MGPLVSAPKRDVRFLRLAEHKDMQRQCRQARLFVPPSRGEHFGPVLAGASCPKGAGRVL